MSTRRLPWLGIVAALLVACGGGNSAGNGDGAAEGGRTGDGGTFDVLNTSDGTGGRDAEPADVEDSGGCGLVTCRSAGANCGMIGDGCGNLINCGTCTAPETCGGGGRPSVCGLPTGDSAACTPRTCESVGANCGPVADGCGNLLMCGTCPMGQTCGGAGTPSVCGVPGTGDGGMACVPRTCMSAGANCGPVSDGCGGLLMCGTCPMGQTCGGGGTPSVCGTPGTSDGGMTCTPRTCAAAGANCGPVADGCGNLLMCGTCPMGQTCGGGGRPSVCGVPGTGDGGMTCMPRTCAAAGANCGPVADGCGGLLMCGTCPLGQTCGGAGTPSVCGVAGSGDGGMTCMPRTCAAAGANCGPVSDGCGNLLMCGTCPMGQTCGGGGTPNVCGTSAPPCTNLCLQQMMCSGGVTTTLTGTVRSPARSNPDPLYGALVYIPNAPVQAFTPGVSCDRCGAAVSGSPLVSATTGPDGRFTLRNVPVGTNIPLVIQLGRWRRQIVIPRVNPCVDNALTSDQTRLPRNRMEGDIPQIAMVTGAVDGLECVLRKMGIDDAEFTNPTGAGRIHMYRENGARLDNNTPAVSTLTGSATTLNRYDMVLFACEGAHTTENATALRNVREYANRGGRIFATHFSYTWIYENGDFANTAQWAQIGQPDPNSPLASTVDQSFPRGMAFAQWLRNVGASTTVGSVNISEPQRSCSAVNPSGQRWIYSTSPATIQHYTFNTPVTAMPDAQCGRALFSNFHVTGVRDASRERFPGECSGTTLTAQEKILEFMIFDLSSCVAPDTNPGGCIPQTCAAQRLSCGPAGDGCGNVIQCGTCPSGQTCGGGGTPGVCGSSTTMCTPRTCAQQNINCGPAGDGCGNVIQCGNCPMGQTCGGGGMPGVCGAPSCVPTTCTQQGIMCGPAGDGCGNVIQCGNCPMGQTCGGGGVPGVCGSGTCMARTCAQQGLSCGPAGDGCGNVIQCGTCPMGQTCGGGGMPGVCGAPTCASRTCAQQNIMCGPAGDGCGNVIQCGNCPAGQTCGGGGVPGVCGAGSCMPRTCAAQGISCGPAGDGCGNVIQCGTCPMGQSCGGGGIPGICGSPPG